MNADGPPELTTDQVVCMMEHNEDLRLLGIEAIRAHIRDTRTSPRPVATCCSEWTLTTCRASPNGSRSRRDVQRFRYSRQPTRTTCRAQPTDRSAARSSARSNVVSSRAAIVPSARLTKSEGSNGRWYARSAGERTALSMSAAAFLPSA